VPSLANTIVSPGTSSSSFETSGSGAEYAMYHGEVKTAGISRARRRTMRKTMPPRWLIIGSILLRAA